MINLCQRVVKALGSYTLIFTQYRMNKKSSLIPVYAYNSHGENGSCSRCHVSSAIKLAGSVSQSPSLQQNRDHREGKQQQRNGQIHNCEIGDKHVGRARARSGFLSVNHKENENISNNYNNHYKDDHRCMKDRSQVDRVWIRGVALRKKSFVSERVHCLLLCSIWLNFFSVLICKEDWYEHTDCSKIAQINYKIEIIENVWIFWGHWKVTFFQWDISFSTTFQRSDLAIRRFF